jgi:2'-5' RNA ligase
MTTIRAFIAIELSDAARAAITDLQNRLKTVVPPRAVRWTAPQNIHLTLHFLGNITTGEVEKVTAALDAATTTGHPFSLDLSGLGCFPNSRRPRIVWVGVLGKTASLVALHRDLGDRLNKAIDFSPESRPYSPHLTIGRVKKGVRPRHLRQLGPVLEQEQARVGQLARLKVDEISLIKSELKPTGPVYTKLSEGLL